MGTAVPGLATPDLQDQVVNLECLESYILSKDEGGST
jgi:hypothetical protein